MNKRGAPERRLRSAAKIAHSQPNPRHRRSKKGPGDPEVGAAALKQREVRSLDGWRGQALDLNLGDIDRDLVDNALCLNPALRVVVRLGQEARRRGVTYPVKSAAQLVSCLGRDSLKLAGHRVSAKSIAHALAGEWFPIVHEGELLTVIHLALRRCEAEAAAASLEQIRSHSKSVVQRRKRE